MKLFGTDGIRGRAGNFPLDVQTAVRIGIATGKSIRENAMSPQVVLGRDTRDSSPFLEAAIGAGLMSEGIEILNVGVVPKPAAAHLTKHFCASIGIYLTASHNPHPDNGFHFFDRDGGKLQDALEAQIENSFFSNETSGTSQHTSFGQNTPIADSGAIYLEQVLKTIEPSLSLKGIKVVVDCAHGASYVLAPEILRRLGADVTEIGTAPDGRNINLDCGSTHIGLLVSTVRAKRADIGIAFDGDADRFLLVDENGDVVDNDQVLALLAKSWNTKGKLRGGGVVGTVMTSLGLERFLESYQLKLERTHVGDRYVIEAMRNGGFNLGGETSGHFVFLDHSLTGDGIAAALQVLSELVSHQQPLSAVCKQFDKTAQLLVNTRFGEIDPLQSEIVQGAISRADERLNGNGRLLIRRSGFEPIIRVLGESYDEEVLQDVVNDVRASIQLAVDDPVALLRDLDDGNNLISSIISVTARELQEELITFIKRNPDKIFDLPPRKFEELIAGILFDLGWSVDLTQQSKDGGYDIFAVSKDIAGVTTAWVVECKRFSRHRKVGVEVVRSLFGTPIVQKGANALLVTTSSFTKGVKDYKASRYNLELRDYHGVLEWVNTYRPNPNGNLLLRDNKLIRPD